MDMFNGWTSEPEKAFKDYQQQQQQQQLQGAAGSSGGGSGDNNSGVVDAGGDIVLLVAREREEHANTFHATTDWINCFLVLSLAGVLNPSTGGPMGGHHHHQGGGASVAQAMASVQVVLLDEQQGPFEDLWYKRIFSPAHPLLRVSQLQASGVRALRMRRALFVPPGYTNMLLSHVHSEGDCHAGTQLLQGYRGFVLAALGLKPLARVAQQQAQQAQQAPLRVVFVSRRPYTAAGMNHGFMGRQVENEEELLAGLRAALAEGTGAGGLFAAVEVERVDLALLDAAEQVALIAERTDVLLGMHGAALTYAALLPPWAAVVEMWPKAADIWRCFEHLTAMAGLLYERWENVEFPGRFRQDGGGDYTQVSIPDVVALVLKAVRHAAQQRASSAAAASSVT